MERTLRRRRRQLVYQFENYLSRFQDLLSRRENSFPASGKKSFVKKI
jgi:hypothetical protein